MQLTVEQIHDPTSPMSSVCTGLARNEAGDVVRFAGEVRDMRELALRLEEGEAPVVEVEPWQVLGMVA